MIELRFFIPLANNAGVLFTQDHHAAFERYAATRLGGISKMPGEVSGQWVSDGTIYADRLVEYIVAFASIFHVAKLAAVFAYAARHYDQKAIYVRYAGHAELYLPPPPLAKALPPAKEVAKVG